MNFLFTSWGVGGGHLPPIMPAVCKLLARGHRVRILSEDCSRADIEAVGATFIGWKRAPNRKDRSRNNQTCKDWESATPQDGMRTVIRDFWCGPAAHYAQDVVEELSREPANLVITSEVLFGAMAGCESVGQQFAIFSATLRRKPLPGIPPMGSGLPPARTEQERITHAEYAKSIESVFDSGLPALNSARASLGLVPLLHVFDQYCPAVAELLGTSQAFDFTCDALPAQVRYVGPQIGDPGWAQGWDSPWSESDERPLVLVGFSTTFQNHTAVLQRVIDALTPLPVRILVALGGSIEIDELHGSDNCVIVQSVPYTVVMRETSLVVTHGGHGTVMRSLVNRLPMLLIPHGRDQNDIAVRVTERGAGLSLLPEQASVDSIRSASSRLLNEREFRANAGRLGDLVTKEAENSTFAAELEALATPACARAAV